MDAATDRIVCRPLSGGHHPNGVRNRAPERKSLDRVTAHYPFGVTTETKPPQTEEITRAISEALAAEEPPRIPGGRQGKEALDDDLESFDG